MELLSGIQDRFDSLISSLEALGDDEKHFIFSYVRSSIDS